MEPELVRRCQAGDEQAFKELFEKHYRRAFGVARHVVGKHDLALDVTQQAFVEVYKHIREFDVSRSFYTWLYQIVVNRSIDCMRRQARRKSVPFEDHPSRFAAPEAVLDRIDVRECLDKLPELYRTALMLRDIEGLSCEEIAHAMKCTNGTARWRVHQARKLFKEAWELSNAPEPAFA
jgi:RNA polymerase sigma-70 factor (ECF subfamily)